MRHAVLGDAPFCGEAGDGFALAEQRDGEGDRVAATIDLIGAVGGDLEFVAASGARRGKTARNQRRGDNETKGMAAEYAHGAG